MTETPLPVLFDPKTLESARRRLAGPRPAHDRAPAPRPRHRRGAFLRGQVRPAHLYRLYAPRRRRRQREIAKLPVSRPAYMHSFGHHRALRGAHRVPAGGEPAASSRAPSGRSSRTTAGSPSAARRSSSSTGDRRARRSRRRRAVLLLPPRERLRGRRRARRRPRRLRGRRDRARALSRPAAAGGPIPVAELRRYRVPLAAARRGARPSRPASSCRGSTTAAHNGRPYRFVYGNHAPGGRPGRSSPISRRATSPTGGVVDWSEPGCYPGEPVFVPAPEAGAEDDGVSPLGGPRRDGRALVPARARRPRPIRDRPRGGAARDPVRVPRAVPRA